MVTVTTQGLEQPASVADFRERLGPIALRGLEKIAADAAGHAPVRTGKLRRSIRAVPGDVRKAELGRIIAVPYWHLLEYGHQIVVRGPGRAGKTKGQLGRLRSKLKARRRVAAVLRGTVAPEPFLEPALASGEAELVESLEDAFRDLLR